MYQLGILEVCNINNILYGQKEIQEVVSYADEVMKTVVFLFFLYPRFEKVGGGGVYWFTSVRPSVRPSVIP